MFHLCMFIFSVMLFFILTPGIALTIPPKSSKSVVALVHALVFATVWHFTHKLVWHASEGFEGLSYSDAVEKVKLEKMVKAAEAKAAAAAKAAKEKTSKG